MSSMKIIIPIAGSSEDFEKEGLGHKPLIRIDNKTMIENVYSMFPKTTDILFICREENRQKLEPTIKKLDHGTLISINKPTRGSMETILEADLFVDKDDEIIVQHDDSLSVFDFNDFISAARHADGALTVFAGFNPAAYTGQTYGLIKADKNRVTEIVEKQPFALTAEHGYTATGTYYFKSWSLFKQCAGKLLRENKSLNGIFYDSLVYNEMIADGKSVVSFNAAQFINWGSPTSVKEYLFWSNYFSGLLKKKQRVAHNMINLIPAAGRGKRFVDAGYTTPKALINVLGRPMIVGSALSLPKASRNIFVILKEQVTQYSLDKVFKENIPSCDIVVIDDVTDGMARTCLMAEHLLEKDKQLLISSCDYSFVYDEEKLKQIIDREKPDAMIWTFREYPDARLAPKAYAYVVIENGRITRISEKVPISDTPHKDHIVQGIFWFKDVETFLWCAKQMIEKKITVNGEYYVATAMNELIEAGKKVVPFELEKYICWGTPLDLKTFEFWENYFSDLSSHPYVKGVNVW